MKKLDTTLEQFKSENPRTYKICKDLISWMFSEAYGAPQSEERLDEIVFNGFDGINVNCLYAIEKALEELEKLKMEQYF